MDRSSYNAAEGRAKLKWISRLRKCEVKHIIQEMVPSAKDVDNNFWK